MPDDVCKIRVVIVEDYAVVREGLRRLLQDLPDIQVIADTEYAEEAVRIVQEEAPDVVLFDLVLETSQISGLDALREILTQSPVTRVVILSAYSDERLVIPALAAGAAGYVLKNAHPDEVIEAIRDASKGQFHISPLITKKIVDHLLSAESASDHGSAEAKLTRRELEILPLISRGLSNQEIADHLTISPATVKTHVSNILHKLGLKDRNRVADWLAQHQVLSLS